MYKRLIHRTLVVAAGTFVSWQMIKALGPWMGVGAWALLMGLICFTAIALLKSTKTGEMSWKNYLAGYTTPWGWSFCRNGSLVPAALVSTLIWTGIGVGAALIIHGQNAMTPPAVLDSSAPVQTSTAWPRVLRVLLFAFWAIDAGVVMLIFQRMAVTFGFSSSSSKSLIKVMLIVLATIAGSVAFYLNGHLVKAVLTAGALPTLVGLFFGAYILIVLTAGKNARWN